MFGPHFFYIVAEDKEYKDLKKQIKYFLGEDIYCPLVFMFLAWNVQYLTFLPVSYLF